MPDDMLETFKAQGITEGSPQHVRLLRLQAKVLYTAKANDYSVHDMVTSVKVIMGAALSHADQLVAIDTERTTLATERVVNHINSLSPEKKRGLLLFAEDSARQRYGEDMTDDHVDEQVVELLRTTGAVNIEDILADHRLKEEVILRCAIARLPSDARMVASVILDAMYPQE